MDNVNIGCCRILETMVPPSPVPRIPTDEESVRKKAIRLYTVLSLVQLLSGTCLVLCSGLGLRYGAGTSGVPYVVGGFVIGGLLLSSGLLAFRVYNKGPDFTTSERTKKEVMCAVNWHRLASFSMVLSCVISVAIIWMYGLCFEGDTDCSYDDHLIENKVIAILSVVIGIVGGLGTSAAGIYIIRKYGRSFGMVLTEDPTGSLTFVGFQNESARQIQQDNSVLQRRLPQNELQYEPFVPIQGRTEGYTNLGFIPPELPPYSSSSDAPMYTPGPIVPHTSAGVHNTVPSTHVKYFGGDIRFIPDEPPPPYSEIVQNMAYTQSSGTISHRDNVENVDQDNESSKL